MDSEMENKNMKLISWNVNGIRSTEKALLKFLRNENPDILMIQEMKAFPYQLSFFLQMIPGYKTFWNPAQRPGYSGTAFFCKDTLPINNVVKGKSDIDEEGRIVTLESPDYIIINGYFPNGCGNADRLEFKLNFYTDFLKYLDSLKQKQKHVIVGGDFNVCYTENDIWSPTLYKGRSPFLQTEKDWFTAFIKRGFKDSFREHYPDVPRRTWWHPRDVDRPDTRGLGIDYFVISDSLRDSVVRAEILREVYGSDHCPILLEIDT